MGIFIVLIIIVFVIGFIVINIKIGDLKYRAQQHILKDTGLSSSEINAGITNTFEHKYLEKFLLEHPSFTEESIKNLLNQYVTRIFNKDSMNEFSQTVYEKMQKDTKLEQFKNMEFKRVNLNYYGNQRLQATVVYTDNKDEYNIFLVCRILGDKIQVDKYRIDKGSVVGF